MSTRKSELKSLETLLSQGRITRREFMVRVTALGLASALSPTLLTSSARAQTPKQGGRFRMGLSGANTTDSLDPATIYESMAQNVNYQLRNNLVEVDHKGNALPELAESWEPTRDVKTWTFKLRRGIEFHNGKTMDSEDVIDSINYHRGVDSKSGAKGAVAPIKDIKSDGKYTVIFTLDAGNVDFPYILSDFHLTIFPADTKGAEFQKGIGTGGYILQSWEPGVRALTKRNPNYWKKGQAHFDEVEIHGIPDLSARTNGLITGMVDYINSCDVKTVDLLRQKPNIQIIRVQGGAHQLWAMRTDVKPFDNNDVRLALKYAVDREHLVKTVLRGYGTVGNDNPIAPCYRYYAELPQREYDPDKAKFHLKKAGIEGYTFKLYTSEKSAYIDSSVLYKEHAAKAGINIELVKAPIDGYWDNVWMKEPFCSSEWNARATIDAFLSVVYAADAKWNETYWKHERFSGLLASARAELNETKRREMYVECQRIIRDEGGAIIYLFHDHVEAAASKVGHADIAGNLPCDGQKNAERWWFVS